jgi:hypothetical protein
MVLYSCGPPADAGKEAVRYQTEYKHGRVAYKPDEEAKNYLNSSDGINPVFYSLPVSVCLIIC